MKLFSTNSYDDISIDDVAQAAGMSKGLLYHYFGGKREFYVATIRHASLQLRELTEPDPRLPPGARLRAAVDAHLTYVRDHGPVYAALSRGGAAVAREISGILEEHRHVIMQYFLRDFRVARPRPLLRMALRAWIAMVQEACLDWLAHPEMKRDQLRDLLIASYVAMLAKAGDLDPEIARMLTTRPIAPPPSPSGTLVRY
jgi:AcrR family transcriptional regulator